MLQLPYVAFRQLPGGGGGGSRKFPEPLLPFQPGTLAFGVLPGGERQFRLTGFTGDFPAQQAAYQR